MNTFEKFVTDYLYHIKVFTEVSDDESCYSITSVENKIVDGHESIVVTYKHARNPQPSVVTVYFSELLGFLTWSKDNLCHDNLLDYLAEEIEGDMQDGVDSGVKDAAKRTLYYAFLSPQHALSELLERINERISDKNEIRALNRN